MPKLTFYPLGNADCCLVDLANGKKLLFDYAAKRNPDDPEDLRVDLPKLLRNDLTAAKRKGYDVVAFSHLDDDHIRGASDFFWLEHAEKYQGDERIKIGTLWVPAAAIIEEGCEDEDKIIRVEARHRLLTGKGIRVFSRPEALKDWLENNGLSLEDRRGLFTDAGQIVPDFSKTADGVEFFVHSPFASRLDDGSVLDRNTDALALQATFICDGVETKFILSSDLDHECFRRIVKITKIKKNESRLEWDVFKLPHHCSYTALSPEKGDEKTKPIPEVAWLFETQGLERGIVVSTCKPIPSNDDDDQPPHRQAANYYKELMGNKGGAFKATMEHPNKISPEPLVINIDSSKATIEKRFSSGAAAIVSRPLRAG